MASPTDAGYVPGSRKFQKVNLDGNIADVIKSMNGQLAARNPSVGEWGCRAIMDYAKSGELRSLEIADMGADAAVVKAMTDHPASASAQAQACQALSFLACSDTLRERLNEAGCVPLVAAALGNHRDARQVQFHGCSAVTALGMLELNALACAEHGVPAHVVAALSHFPDDDQLQETACLTISTLSEHGETVRVAVAAAGGVGCIYHTIRKHNNVSMTVRRACEALERLAIQDDIRLNMSKDGGLQLIVETLQGHKKDADIVQGTGRVIARMAQSEVNRVMLISMGVMDLMVEVMDFHLANVDVQLYSCWALVELAAEEDADGSKSVHEQVVDAVLAAMTKHVSNVDVHRYGCKALENLASRSEAQRVQIGEKNAVQIILNGVREHASVADVQQNAFHALAVIASNDSTMHVHMAQLRAVEAAEKAFKAHSKAPSVLANLCRFMANVALTVKVRDLMVKHKLLPRVLCTLKEFENHADAQHYSMWCLENFAVNASLRSSIQENGGRESALSAMEKHKDDADVLLAGIRLLERLACDANGHVVLASSSVIAVIKAMRTHAEDGDVQHCACAALAVLTRNVKNKVAFFKEDGTATIMDALRTLGGVPIVAQYACGVLSNIALKDAKVKTNLAQDGALKLVFNLLGIHRENPTVCIAICAVLRNLTSSHDANRKALIDLKAIFPLTELLQLHENQFDTVYWAAAVLCNLSRDPAGQAVAAAKSRKICVELMAKLEKACPTDPAFSMVAELVSRLPAPVAGQRIR